MRYDSLVVFHRVNVAGLTPLSSHKAAMLIFEDFAKDFTNS